jgi:hypothetical protein
MVNFANEVRRNLKPLIGLRLSRIGVAADMRTLQFGDAVARKGGGMVGEYSLHIQCPWRLEDEKKVITGSSDLFLPSAEGEQSDESFDSRAGGTLQERVLRKLLKGYDQNTKQIVNATNLFTVEDFQADSAGGFNLALSGGYLLSVFPDGTRHEAWRLFRPSNDGHDPNEKHFVVPYHK